MNNFNSLLKIYSEKDIKISKGNSSHLYVLSQANNYPNGKNVKKIETHLKHLKKAIGDSLDISSNFNSKSGCLGNLWNMNNGTFLATTNPYNYTEEQVSRYIESVQNAFDLFNKIIFLGKIKNHFVFRVYKNKKAGNYYTAKLLRIYPIRAIHSVYYPDLITRYNKALEQGLSDQDCFQLHEYFNFLFKNASYCLTSTNWQSGLIPMYKEYNKNLLNPFSINILFSPLRNYGFLTSSEQLKVENRNYNLLKAMTEEKYVDVINILKEKTCKIAPWVDNFNFNKLENYIKETYGKNHYVMKYYFSTKTIENTTYFNLDRLSNNSIIRYDNYLYIAKNLIYGNKSLPNYLKIPISEITN
jgi:hypothetical protein